MTSRIDEERAEEVIAAARNDAHLGSRRLDWLVVSFTACFTCRSRRVLRSRLHYSSRSIDPTPSSGCDFLTFATVCA
jgi:hypothetical protein